MVLVDMYAYYCTCWGNIRIDGQVIMFDSWTFDLGTKYFPSKLLKQDEAEHQVETFGAKDFVLR